jgi:hypothetical protein
VTGRVLPADPNAVADGSQRGARGVRDARFVAALLLLGLLAALPSALGIPQRWLWYDEILSAVFSANGPWATLMTVLRFDVHPPLYYLQLSLWMLVGQSDVWLMANAVLWHVLAVLLLGWTAAGRYGPSVGLGAALLLAVSPAALAYADHVRMYSFVMLLIVLAWHVQARWLEGTAGRYGWLWMVLAQAAVANSHTGGLLMLSGCVVLGAAAVAATGQRARMLRWLLIEAAVLPLAALPLAIGAFRGVVHLEAPDAGAVLDVWTFLAGGKDTPSGVALGLGIAVLGGLIAGGVRDRILARDAAALILVPLVVAAVLSHVHKPVWIERLFVPVIPFLCLCLARAALLPASPRRMRAGAALLLLLAMLWGGIAATIVVPRPKGDGFRLAAEAVRATARPGDTVLVEGDFAHWCLLWYLAGPRWGDPRQAFVQSPEWEALLRRLPSAGAIMGLGDADVVRPVDGVAVVLWNPALPPPRVSQGEVLLLRLRSSPAVAVPDRRMTGSTPHVQFVLERWSRAPA